jgi:hypothetical protein
MSSAQASITEERSKVASLTENQAALKVVNDRLLLAKDSIDNLLSVKVKRLICCWHRSFPQKLS